MLPTSVTDVYVRYNDRCVQETKNSFVRSEIDNCLNEKAFGINCAEIKCHMVCSKIPCISKNKELLKTAHFARLYFIMRYDIIFWGHSFDSSEIYYKRQLWQVLRKESQ